MLHLVKRLVGGRRVMTPRTPCGKRGVSGGVVFRISFHGGGIAQGVIPKRQQDK